uniref:AAA family ATPase n=1 Tax=uncultured Victivallis sp. TaxID=354118 RepID=UPI002597E4DA
NVQRNVAMACGVGKTPEERYEKARDFVRLVGLEDYADLTPPELSTGMRQRLGITLALLPDSEFIILDEPTNGLDPAGIVEIRQIIREYNRQFGVSVMVSSHLLSEVEQICDHLILIDGGRLKAWGEIGELLDSRPRLRLRTDRPESAAALLRRAVAGNALPPCGIENGTDGILLELGESCAGAVNRLLVENGFNVTHLAVERQTLENFFLKETAGDNGHA